MGPTYKIAELLKVSFTEATKYCEEVRSLRGLGPTLPYKTIAHHLTQYTNEMPSTQRMAEIVKKNPLITRSAQKTKLNKVKQVPVAKPRRWNISRALAKEKRSKSRFERPAKPTTPPAYVVRTSYFDQERVSEQKLERCPHGVPHGRVCAICDPKKFREMTGMD